METFEVGSQIEKYIVRIGIDDTKKTLKGSGILFPVKMGKEIYVLTAAHVVYPLIQKMKEEGLRICLSCKDTVDNIQNIVIDNVEDIYIHTKYNETKNEYFYDAAVIQISWEDWMNELCGYEFESSEKEEKVFGYGFPEALDEEKNRSLANLFSGKAPFSGIVEDKNVGRLAISYLANVEGDITRDSVLEGYSGTGLFAQKSGRLYIRGVVSCSRGTTAAGFTLWATDIEIIMQLIKERGIELEYPDSFQVYGEMVAAEFDSFKTKCIRNWNEAVEKIIDDNMIIPRMFHDQVDNNLPCEGNPKTCAEFWKGKLKELVIMQEVQKLNNEQLFRPIVKLPQMDEEEIISLEFLCTELKAEHILGQMIENYQFNQNGRYHNNMIMLLNAKKGHDNCTILFPRRDCRSIMGNIAGKYETDTSKKLYARIYHLVDKNMKNANFDIIKGNMEQCNIAAIGTKRIMEVMNKEDPERRKRKMNEILEELWEE